MIFRGVKPDPAQASASMVGRSPYASWSQASSRRSRRLIESGFGEGVFVVESYEEFVFVRSAVVVMPSAERQAGRVVADDGQVQRARRQALHQRALVPSTATISTSGLASPKRP